MNNRYQQYKIGDNLTASIRCTYVKLFTIKNGVEERVYNLQRKDANFLIGKTQINTNLSDTNILVPITISDKLKNLSFNKGNKIIFPFAEYDILYVKPCSCIWLKNDEISIDEEVPEQQEVIQNNNINFSNKKILGVTLIALGLIMK